MKRRIMAGLLCMVFAILLFDTVLAQERQQRPQRKWRWKGPDIGTEIKDFSLPILGGGEFTLSKHKGQIVIIELGACT